MMFKALCFLVIISCSENTFAGNDLALSDTNREKRADEFRSRLHSLESADPSRALKLTQVRAGSLGLSVPISLKEARAINNSADAAAYLNERTLSKLFNSFPKANQNATYLLPMDLSPRLIEKPSIQDFLGEATVKYDGPATIDFISRANAIPPTNLPAINTEEIEYIGVELDYLVKNVFLTPTSTVVGTFPAQDILVRGNGYGEKLGIRFVIAEDLQNLRRMIAVYLERNHEQIDIPNLQFEDGSLHPQLKIHLLNARYETVRIIRADGETRDMILQPVFKLFGKEKIWPEKMFDGCQNLLKNIIERPSWF